MADRHIKVQLKDPEPNETSNFRQRIYYYDFWYPVTKAEYVEGLRNGSKWFDGTSITASTSPIPEGLDVNIGDYYLNSNTWNIWECISLDDTETTDRWLLVGNIKGADGNSINIKGSVTSPTNLPIVSAELGDCYVINGSSTPAENGHLWVYTGTTISDSTHVNGYEDLGSLQGPAGIGIYYSSATTGSGTATINNNTITNYGRTLQVGDLIISASDDLFKITDVNSTNCSIYYITNIKGTDGTDGATWQSGTAVTSESSSVPTGMKVGDYYLNNSTWDVYKCINTSVSETNKWHLECNIQGPEGDQGIQGPSGANGNSIFLRYSASSSGNPMHTSFQQGDKYIGIYTGQAASANYQDYTWCKFIGDDGSTVGDTWRAIKVNGTEKLGTNPASSGNGPIDFKPGNHISISFNSTGNTLNIAHSNTSTQASVSNSGRTYIQSIELDDDGHVTNLASHTETVTNTDRYVNNAAFADDTTNNSSSPVKMTLTRAGSDSATVTANIPKISSTSAGVVPKGNVVSSQTQSTKFLREDGEWHAPSYTTGGTTVQQRQHATANELYPILCTETSTQTSPTDLTTVGYNNKVKLSKTNIIIEQAGTNPTKKYEYGGSSPITVYNNNNQAQKGVIISGGIAAATISNTYLKWDGTNFVWDSAGGTAYTGGTGIQIDSSNVISCTITSTSQLTNDSGFITDDKYQSPYSGSGYSSGGTQISTAHGSGLAALTVPYANASVAGVSKVTEVDDTLQSETYKGERWVEVVMDKTGKLFVPIDF